jgi:ribosomal-protein-alanine N-acetyltransferase
MALAFRQFGPQRMQARVIEGNAASCRVLEKLGFRYEGTLRASLLRRGKFEDVLFYSLLRSEWKEDPGGVPGPSTTASELQLRASTNVNRG